MRDAEEIESGNVFPLVSLGYSEYLINIYLRASWLIQARSVHSPLTRRLPSRVLLPLSVEAVHLWVIKATKRLLSTQCL